MAPAVLVDARRRAGQELVGRLHRRGVPVTAAGWLVTAHEQAWHLAVVTPAVDSLGITRSYHEVYEALRPLDQAPVGIGDVKLFRPADPVSLAVVEAAEVFDEEPRDEWDGLFSSRSTALQALGYEECYPLPPVGRMTPKQVVQAVAALMNRTGVVAPSQFQLTNGQTLSAVPVGIDMRYPEGGVSFKLLNTATGKTEPHAVADIVDVG